MSLSAAEIKALPKAELHRHLEGCVRTATVIDIASRRGLPLPSFDRAELEKVYKLREPGASLSAVLAMFGLAQASFASYEDIERIVFEALDDARRKENIRLLELRYSPDFMLRGKGLDWQRAHDIMAGALARWEKTSDMVCGLIVIASRSYGLASAEKTAEFALQNRRTVIGFDLADDEASYPAEQYAPLARRLREGGLPLTVHSGEEGHYSQVTRALEHLQPRRVGHGVMAAEDPSGGVMEDLRRRDVTVETNPWSNYLTRAVPSVERHPLKKFIAAGLRCSIGADDPEILGTDLNSEYALASEKMGLGREEILYTLKCAAEGSFLSADRRQQAARDLGVEGARI
jgi:adenosine deaminase